MLLLDLRCRLYNWIALLQTIPRKQTKSHSMSEFDRPLIEAYWQRFLDSLPDSVDKPTVYDADAFGDNPELADELAALVVEGIKTATCGDLWYYEANDVPLPYVGEWWIVLDGRGSPVAVTETMEVDDKPLRSRLMQGLHSTKGRAIVRWPTGARPTALFQPHAACHWARVLRGDAAGLCAIPGGVPVSELTTALSRNVPSATVDMAPAARASASDSWTSCAARGAGHSAGQHGIFAG